MIERSFFGLTLLFSAALGVSTGPITRADEPRALPPAAKQKVEYVRDVRPIFASHCLKCHGPSKQEAGLRLDRRDEALNGGDSGPAFVSGKSEESLLIKYVAGVDPDVLMPPEGEKLSDEQIGLLRGWIDQGADWPEDKSATNERRSNHWSFQPIRDPKPPATDTTAINPVDAFVLSILRERHLTPSGEADQATLIRRLSLDLLGLPPQASDTAEYLADQRPDAYERLLDRLLASPHFGERWGRHWLDLARYADSDGYEKDLPRPHAWRWRDWAIEAFNRDLPFDQFTIEQLAGDLLPGATLDQRIATGFHRNTLTNKEGGIDKKEDRDKQLVDRTNTTGAVWLGLTVGCAQCHSHKYDPISHREYYQLYAFFNAADEQDILAPTASQLELYALRKAQHDVARAPLVHAVQQYRETKLPARFAEWESTVKPAADWSVLEIVEFKSISGATAARQKDGSWLVSGSTPDVDSYTLTIETSLLPGKWTGLKLEALTDKSLPGQGPGRAPNGNFVLTNLSVTPLGAEGDSPSKPLKCETAFADFAQGSFPIAQAIDDSPKTGWAVAPQMGKPHVALFGFTRTSANDEQPATTKEDSAVAKTRLSIVLDQQYGGEHTLGRFRLSVTTLAGPLTLNDPPAEVSKVLAVPTAERTPKQRDVLVNYFAKLDPEFQKLEAALAKFDDAGPKPPATQAMILAESTKPQPTHVHIRGDFLRPGTEVQPAGLSVLNPLRKEEGKDAGDPPASTASRPNRLELAKWVVDEANPLTRRVAVNRVWQHLFGRGLVDPPDDFGTQGARPSHPELLDWLATEFSRREWSRKQMIRLIATSATYRQSSSTRRELNAVDPKNVWLARQNRFRLEGEIIRDLALSVSGLLDDRVGGESVRPPLPAGVADLGYAGSVKWAESKGGDRYRRGCYVFFQRTVPYPLLMTFDGPDSNVTCARRERSNTPLQSLTLLNDPAFFECARAFGTRLDEEVTGDPTTRCREAFRRTTGRDPVSDEMETLVSLYEASRRQLQSSPNDATAIVAGATTPSGSTIDLATSITFARILLNLDEFFTRE